MDQITCHILSSISQTKPVAFKKATNNKTAILNRQNLIITPARFYSNGAQQKPYYFTINMLHIFLSVKRYYVPLSLHWSDIT